jgi:putative MFS transporter
MEDFIMANTDAAATGAPRTVQDYIDERPIWPDGTRLTSAPMTSMQRRIWMLAAAGKFFEGFVVFMTGVALPLTAVQHHAGAAWTGQCCQSLRYLDRRSWAGQLV